MPELLQRTLRALRAWWRSRPAHDLAPAAAGSAALCAAPPAERGEPAPLGRPTSRPSGAGRTAGEPVRRFLLSVDDAGVYLVVTGTRLTLGHLRAARADLPFLADVGPLHAELVRGSSLREGPVWSLRPLGGERVRVDGRALGEEGCRLADGDHVQLGENLAFRLAVPDPASETVLLELLGGIDCGGAHHVVLLGEGEGGRLRIGPAGQRHVRVAGLEHEVAIRRVGERLLVRREPGAAGWPAGEPAELTLPFPPRERVQLDLGRPREGRPPLGIAVGPVELPEVRR